MNHCRHHHLLTAPTITQRRAAPEELIATPPRNTARLSPTIPPDCSASPADASDGADRARLGAYEKAAKCSKEMTSQKEPFDLEPVVTVRDRTNLPAKQMSIHDVEEERRRLKELSEHSTPTNLSQSPQQANPTVHLYPPTTATAPRAGGAATTTLPPIHFAIKAHLATGRLSLLLPVLSSHIALQISHSQRVHAAQARNAHNLTRLTDM